MRRAYRVVLASLLFVFATACLNNEAKRVTVVLFDVSASTRAAEIRARYLGAFVDEVVPALADEGGILGVDIIDDNPQAHASLPIKEEFLGCGVLENRLECEDEAKGKLQGVTERAQEIVLPSSRGTDILGALELASSFFEAYSEIEDRQLVIFSDMVQSGRSLHFARDVPAGEAWWRAADMVDLDNVTVYVVGAGATAPDRLTAAQIAEMDAFWRRYLTEAGAEVATYGAALPRFP